MSFDFGILYELCCPFGEVLVIAYVYWKLFRFFGPAELIGYWEVLPVGKEEA